MAEVAVALRDLRKSYGDVEAVRGISFDVEKGEIFGFIGADGAGKTTTFQILAGVMNPTSGDATIFGRSARDARLKTGYLTQGFTLYSDLTVMENIRYIGDLRLAEPKTIDARGRHYLELFGMAPFENRLAGQLSGGMQKKLALACALVPQPRRALARRADDRGRPGFAARVLGFARAARDRRADDSRRDSLFGRSRALHARRLHASG